jgi:hypothetical protein
MSVSDEIKAVYGALAHYPNEPGLPAIEPYIGADYNTPSPGRLRIAAVGINAYISREDLPAHPGWFSHWAGVGGPRFYNGVIREAKELAEEIVGLLGADDLHFSGDGLYVTNAVKRFLPEQTGKQAAHVEQDWFDEGRTVWKQELQRLANAGALPHAIMVFGARSWEPVWRTLWELCEDQNEPAFIRYRSMPSGSPLYHRLNTVDVATPSGQRPLLLFRPDHASTSRKTTVSSLFAMPEFRERVEELRGNIG